MTTAALGIGVVANRAITTSLIAGEVDVDYVEVVPDQAWVDRGRAARPRFTELVDDAATFARFGEKYPLVAHGVGLSIASAIDLDVEYLEQLAAWRERYGFAWLSEHLAAVRVSATGAVDTHAGLALPLPWDEELLAVLVRRLRIAEDILGIPLLLENGVVHTPVPDTDMTETGFLNRLTAQSGCGLLLDLHNLHVNSVNLGIDAYAFLDRLDLSCAREIHVAGGSVLAGAYLDSHAGPCPEQVWRLLEHAVCRCENLRGITFEFHESYFPRLELDGLAGQLDLARQVWRARALTG